MVAEVRDREGRVLNRYAIVKASFSSNWNGSFSVAVSFSWKGTGFVRVFAAGRGDYRHWFHLHRDGTCSEISTFESHSAREQCQARRPQLVQASASPPGAQRLLADLSPAFSAFDDLSFLGGEIDLRSSKGDRSATAKLGRAAAWGTAGAIAALIRAWPLGRFVAASGILGAGASYISDLITDWENSDDPIPPPVPEPDLHTPWVPGPQDMGVPDAPDSTAPVDPADTEGSECNPDKSLCDDVLPMSASSADEITGPDTGAHGAGGAPRGAIAIVKTESDESDDSPGDSDA